MTQKNKQNHNALLNFSEEQACYIVMNQQDLSGESFNQSHDEEDYGDINFDDIQGLTAGNDEDELSDYEESKPAQTFKSKAPQKAKAGARKGKKANKAGKNDSDDDMLSNHDNEYQVDNFRYNQQEEEKHLDPKKQKPQKTINEDDLSDYGDDDDDEISQYQNTLFGDLQSNQDVKSLTGTKKFNSSRDHIDVISDDIKQSQRTNDMVAKRDPKHEMNRFKAEKREKFNESSVSQMDENDKAIAISRKEKVENKKRFSKKQLELVSRKFSDYYAYETNNLGEQIKLRDIGIMFELGHATIHKLYAEWMDDPYFYERIKRYDRYRKQTKNPQRKLTLDRLQHISRLIKENPFLTQYQLCVELNKIEDLKVIKCGKKQDMTRTIVGKLLRMGKFRKKRVKCIPKEKNTSKSLEKRYEYCRKYMELVERKAKVYFLDESGFNLYISDSL